MVKLQISDIKLDISGLPGKEVIIEIYGLETKTSLDPELPIVFYPRYFPLVLMFSSLFAAWKYSSNWIINPVLIFCSINCQNSVVLVIDPVCLLVGGPALIFRLDWHFSRPQLGARQQTILNIDTDIAQPRPSALI